MQSSHRRPIAALLVAVSLGFAASACGSDDAKQTNTPVRNNTGNVNTPGTPSGSGGSTGGNNNSTGGETNEQPQTSTTYAPGTTAASGQPKTGTESGPTGTTGQSTGPSTSGGTGNG